MSARPTDTSPGSSWSRPGWPEWLPPRHLVHLIYLGALAFQPLAGDDPLTDGVIAVGLAVAYLPLFVLSRHPRRAVTRPAVVATVILATVGSLVNYGAATLFIYAGGTVVWSERRRVAMRVLAGLTGVLAALLAFAPTPWPYRAFGIVPAMVFLWVVAWQSFAEIQAAREATRLRVDNARIEQLSAASERERIARDMHDLLGQSLTSLVVRAQLVQGLVEVHPDQAAAHAQGLEVDARAALDQLRASVSGLREVFLDEELDNARKTLNAAGVQVTVAASDERPAPLTERALALALREGVTNVVRHARARRCTISLQRSGREWLLEVVDDGVGVDGADTGNGLAGMAERIMAIGGRIAVDAGGARGTRLTVAVPS